MTEIRHEETAGRPPSHLHPAVSPANIVSVAPVSVAGSWGYLNDAEVESRQGHLGYQIQD